MPCHRIRYLYLGSVASPGRVVIRGTFSHARVVHFACYLVNESSRFSLKKKIKVTNNTICFCCKSRKHMLEIDLSFARYNTIRF